MSFLDKAGKVCGAVVRGTADALGHESERRSKNRSLSEEEREAYRDYADKMYNVRDTFSDDDY